MGDTLRAFGRLWMNGSQESTPAEASSELHQPLHPPACADTSERTDEVRPRRHSLYSQIHPTATTAVVPAILDTSSDSSSTHNTVAPAPAGRLSGATLADTADLPQQRPLALHTHGLASCDTLCLSSSAQSTGVESDDIAPLPAVARKSMANAANHPKSRASRRHTVTSAVATSLRQALLNMRIQ
ncbi:hypothetical protein THASP1DRAFT_28857 [Thamnocephalis sphaerospora]|uniref:Uncharacterized protein n=1 Tax=Thamnocephalis sphaerospora TaxID=78915 RepID=A0A4P9XT66_9FUNG|nr:hypothetical protein THASP1DRAFT_28857 [Thamnocephalis sphaerospora]|eukprot:RKP09358.1 hypothetical protein THASP1DRAFT_28857 [Thamnocephalis sphaerospora]